MVDRVTLVSYDEANGTATVVVHSTGREEVLENVLIDGLPTVNGLFKREAYEEGWILDPIGLSEHRAENIKLKNRKLVLPSVGESDIFNIKLEDLFDAFDPKPQGLNATSWKTLELENEVFAYDNTGQVLYLVGIGDLEVLAQRFNDLAAREQEEKAREDQERQHRKERAETKALWKDAKENEKDPSRIINPYTFVPIPSGGAGPARRSPAGHHQICKGNLAGTIQVSWIAQSPIMVGGGELNNHGQGDKGPTSRFPRTADGRPMIPGSGLKGAIRSLHETLCGSCYRVINLEFVPTYRQAVASAIKPTDKSWHIGVASGVNQDGRPTEFVSSNELLSIHQGALKKALSGKAKDVVWESGSRVSIPTNSITNHSSRGKVVNQTGEIKHDPNGEWVLLLSDAKARRKEKDYWATAARIGRPGKELGVLAGPDNTVWSKYQRLAAGSDDQRRSRQNQDSSKRETNSNTKPDHLKIEFNRETIGYRQEVLTELRMGDVVWLKVEAGNVQEIRRAQAWRVEGEHNVGTRLRPAYQPCGTEWSGSASESDTELDLCPSCALFGSAAVGEVEERKKQAAQRSYRGHVRIGPAVAQKGTKVEHLNRAPLSSPRPGSGQFYLTPSDKRVKSPKKGAPPVLPLSNWGSEADSPLRNIRGRKYYWHGVNNRHKYANNSTNDTLAELVEVLPIDTKLSSTITFENLTPEMLGGLLVAIQPELALKAFQTTFADTGEILTHLGGGRPLGLGSVEPTLTLQIHNGPSRYRNEAPPSFQIEKLVERWQLSVPEVVKETWYPLTAALSSARVNPARIQYPSIEDKFFKNSSAESTANENPMLTLPELHEIDQTMPKDGKPLFNWGG